MKIVIKNTDMQISSIDNFFEKFPEFSKNYELADQTTRILKALTRCADTQRIDDMTDKVSNGHSFVVYGKYRTYTIVFEIENDTIVLKDLW